VSLVVLIDDDRARAAVVVATRMTDRALRVSKERGLWHERVAAKA
jgi:hypothetical protein